MERERETKKRKMIAKGREKENNKGDRNRGKEVMKKSEKEERK